MPGLSEKNYLPWYLTTGSFLLGALKYLNFGKPTISAPWQEWFSQAL
jgi:hypothetical protein